MLVLCGPWEDLIVKYRFFDYARICGRRFGRIVRKGGFRNFFAVVNWHLRFLDSWTGRKMFHSFNWCDFLHYSAELTALEAKNGSVLICYLYLSDPADCSILFTKTICESDDWRPADEDWLTSSQKGTSIWKNQAITSTHFSIAISMTSKTFKDTRKGWNHPQIRYPL